MFQTVGQLSGGEKAKAALARLCATAANLLVMDEPTNHLDIWSCEALERSINEFEGTVLVVSHDRYFLNQVADRLIVLADGRPASIEGDYETYQHLVQQEEGSRRRPRPAPKAAPPASASSRAARIAASGPKKKFPYRKAAEIEREIGELESRGRRARRPARPARHLARPGQGRPTQDRHRDLKARLETLYQHWETPSKRTGRGRREHRSVLKTERSPSSHGRASKPVRNELAPLSRCRCSFSSGPPPGRC